MLLTRTSPLLRSALSRPTNKHILQLKFQRNVSITTPHQLLERRADRPLPDPMKTRRMILRSLPFFLVAVGGSALAIFNYQKANSSVVASTLYALRVNEEAREVLGDEIQFKANTPWIKGELNQFGGVIDIEYDVKGKKTEGTMKFKSLRKTKQGLFKTEVWDLVLKDGTVLHLLDDSKADPMPQPEPNSPLEM